MPIDLIDSTDCHVRQMSDVQNSIVSPPIFVAKPSDVVKSIGLQQYGKLLGDIFKPQHMINRLLSVGVSEFVHRYAVTQNARTETQHIIKLLLYPCVHGILILGHFLDSTRPVELRYHSTVRIPHYCKCIRAIIHIVAMSKLARRAVPWLYLPSLIGGVAGQNFHV